MQYQLSVLTLLLLLSISWNGLAQDRAQLREEIDKVIHFETEISHDNIPGFTIGVIFQDSTYIYNYGHQSKKNDLILTDSSLFEIGSVTKVFTASLVSILVEEGVMSYEAPFNSYLKSKCQNNELDDITIAQLLNHSSGLPKMPVDFGAHEKELNNPYAHYSKKQLLNFYKKHKPGKRNPKESAYLYSNVNYGLLEIAIENATGKSYEAILEEKILQPAGMIHTFASSDSKRTDRQPLTKGYSRNGKATSPWAFKSFTASEGLKSSTTDLLTFLKMHLDLKETPYADLFEKNTEEQVNTGLSDNAFMGNGWHIIKLRKYYDVVLHSGSTSGHRAFIGFVKETQTGVVILSNSEHGTGGLGYLILRMINFNWKKKRK